MAKITASIVLHNTLEAELTSLLDCICGSSVRLSVYIVDNSPQPLEFSCLRRPCVTYLRPERNCGYGAGHNLAIREILSDADYHFVINPDISFGPNELEKMIRFMHEEENIGQMMPRIIYPDGQIQYLCKLLPAPWDLLIRRFDVALLRGWLTKRMDLFELRFTGYREVMDVPYLSGCFMLFRTSALRDVGLFDERFFMYPEDVDITRRMHAHCRTVFYPGATVVHSHARQSYKTRRALWVHLTNMATYFNKWGWIWDCERRRVNQEVLRRLRLLSEMEISSKTTVRSAEDGSQETGSPF